ncbi:hypothetical protein [Nocardioides sp. SYSU D00038]|uniref:hypothetical protein n=1 Tax=Nocardioides sp. SYSU D00038 TaxID=2812554 RepID=UPI0019682963|nr:hypothetical protein [Nocardioides sp. SYSU D00038]
MAESASRELVLPSLRLDLPPRPSKEQVQALAEQHPDEWATSPRAWVTQQVTRLAVAELLRARLLQTGPGRDQHPIPPDPEQVTLAQLATLFRPHVRLTDQAFELALVEAANAGVPAAVEPLREGLRRVGVTGREPLRVVALGLDKLPPRAAPSFWGAVRTSPAVTAVVDALAGGRAADLSGLDRSQLGRADLLVVGGGRITPVALAARSQEQGSSWLTVPLSVGRDTGRSGGRPGRAEPRPGTVEVGLRGGAWTEVFEAALDAVGSAMRQIDQGGQPRGRTSELAEALAARLVAARDRTVADVCSSLRAVGELATGMFDHQVGTTPVPVAVPVVDDDLFVQLWLPTSSLAGPLVTGSADLFLGGAPTYRGQAGRPSGGQAGQRPGRKSGPGQGRKRPGGPDQSSADQPAGRADEPRSGRSGRRRPSRKPRPDGGAGEAAGTTSESPGPHAAGSSGAEEAVRPVEPQGESVDE